MPIIEHIASGTVVKTSDTRRVLLLKWLNALIAKKGTSNPNNYPFITDTKEMLRRKILRVQDGI